MVFLLFLCKGRGKTKALNAIPRNQGHPYVKFVVSISVPDKWIA
jgi:hypothetical protein